MSMADDMWALVPEVYKRRDADAGNVLRGLIEVLGEQAGVIQDDIAQLYDNWFIETCDDWAAPYIGDLVGALPLAQPGATMSVKQAALLAHVAPARLAIANTIAFRCRKGCFSIIERVAQDVVRWPAMAVEYGRLVSSTHDVRNGVGWGGVAALRDPALLARHEAPNDPPPASVDVRDAAAERSPGRYAPGNIGVFVFTPTLASVSQGDAYCVDEEGAACFTFDPLGQDTALYHGALTASPDGGLPGPITRRRLASLTRHSGSHAWRVDPALFGEQGCTRMWIQAREGEAFNPVERSLAVMPADLAHWRERPPPGFVAIDPERGRIAFPHRAAPNRVRVSYMHATPAEIGGGFARPRSKEAFSKTYLVTALQEEGHDSLRSALEQWSRDGAPTALIEFGDSLTYDEDRLVLEFSQPQHRLVIRAAPHARPVIRLANYESGAVDAWRIRGGGQDGQASLTLEGLTIGGRGVALSDYHGHLHINHCTLIPGWSPNGDRGGRHTDAPSLSFENCIGSATIRSSILGPVFVQANEHMADPLPISLADCVLDAGEDGEAFVSSCGFPYVTLSIKRCTLFGAVTAHALSIAENSIFTDRVTIARRATGCVRYCALPPASRTPRRVACAPGKDDDPALRPVFESSRAGDARFAVLAPTCPDSIARGADDRSEMGVHHNLFRPQRDANLRMALAEYLPADVSVAITYLD